jgi:hypothetical protein
MKKLICHFLSWCFPLKEFEPPWRAMLSLSIAPPDKHRKKIMVEEPLQVARSNAFLALALSLAISALGMVVVQLLFP